MRSIRFRRKRPRTDEEKPKETVGLKVKDYVALFLSGLAAVVSFGTAFWTIARVEENVSVVIRGPQFAFRTGKGMMMPEGAESQLIFINSGNKPVSILNAQVFFLTNKGDKKCEEGHKPVVMFNTFLKPLVVKENEIVTTTVKIDSIESMNHPVAPGKTPIAKNIIDIDESSANEKIGVDSVSCLGIELSTPSIAYQKSYATISKFIMIDDKAFFKSDEDRERKPPQSLYEHFGSIFDRGQKFTVEPEKPTKAAVKS